MSFRAKPANRKQAQNEDESQEEQGGASRGTVPVPGLPADAKWAYALDQSNTIGKKLVPTCDDNGHALEVAHAGSSKFMPSTSTR